MPPSTIETQVKEIVESLRKEVGVWEYLSGSGCAWIPLAVLVVVSLLIGLPTGKWFAAVVVGIVTMPVIWLWIVSMATPRKKKAIAKYGDQCIETFGHDRVKALALLETWAEKGDHWAANLAVYLTYVRPAPKEMPYPDRPDEDRS